MATSNNYPGWHVVAVNCRLIGGFLDRDAARAVARSERGGHYGIRFQEEAQS